MQPALRWSFATATLLLACGGGGSTPTPDAATPDVKVEDDMPVVDRPPVQPDVAPDVPADAARAMFSPCSSARQCGANTVCITVGEGYPGGLCTRACADDEDCGEDGLCLAFGSGMRCFPRCRTFSDCREGYQCFGLSGRPTTERACFPFCSEDAQCAPQRCNAYSRFCGAGADINRADNGGPCESASDCRSSRCTTELNSDNTPSGNLGGICTSRCTIPADSEYAGTRLPRGDCPMGSVCPRDTGASAGTVGTCRVECRENSDCRPGFICSKPRRSGADAGTYENGYCAAMNCHFGTQMCPPIAECRTTQRNDAGMPTSGVCARLAAGRDATNDTGTDATADAPSDVTTDAPRADAAADGTVDATVDAPSDAPRADASAG